MSKTWGNLFDYLGKYIKFGDGKTTKMSITCDNSLRFTKEFCEKYKLDFGAIRVILSSTGGYCDCEVLMNSTDDFPDNLKIPQLPKGRYLMLSPRGNKI